MKTNINQGLEDEFLFFNNFLYCKFATLVKNIKHAYSLFGVILAESTI